jgi:hypothetical protein
VYGTECHPIDGGGPCGLLEARKKVRFAGNSNMGPTASQLDDFLLGFMVTACFERISMFSAILEWNETEMECEGDRTARGFQSFCY